MLEIGVQAGGSLQMWRDYFGPTACIWGMDISPECSKLKPAHFANEQTNILIGDQADRGYLRSLFAPQANDGAPVLPLLDIVVDDGGHHFVQQIASFEELFPHVRQGGVYLVEDTHTSYWPGWGGGVNNPKTFMEYAKRLVDQINAWHIRELPVNEFTHSIESITIYDSVVVIQKKLDCTARRPISERWANATQISVGPHVPK